jgi:hypothetical protein
VEGSAEFKDQDGLARGPAGARRALCRRRVGGRAAAASRVARAGANGASPAVESFIAQRNAMRDRISSINYHRAWAPSDAGEAIYQGHRALSDGSEAVLLKRGDTMLVKAVSRAQAAKASRWKVGQAVRLDDRGRFVDTTRTRKR